MVENQKVATTSQSDLEKNKSKKVPAEFFPRDPLKKVLQIPEAIWKQNAGNPFNILDLAPSVGLSPTSSTFVIQLASCYRYGITEGSRTTKVVTLTPLGLSIVAPTVETNVGSSLRSALLHNSLFNKVYSYFDGKPLPRQEVLKNTLVRSPELGGFGIPREDIDIFIEVFLKNIEDYNLSQDINGTIYLRLDRLGKSFPQAQIESNTQKQETVLGDMEDEQSIESSATPQVSNEPQKSLTKQIFVAHGKNVKPLEQLKSILDQFHVPYKVAIDEANAGRPVSKKVSELMRECSSAIFIFTKDEETKDSQGNTVYRPSDNVVFELGAASVLYENKIVIFKENGVSFGSDFKDLGFISFDTDQLGAKTVELMRELIGFGLLKISAT